MEQELSDFIRQHKNETSAGLFLKYGGKKLGFDLSFAAEQIAGAQKAKNKLPLWCATDNILFPKGLSMEQCSSEEAAKYKAAFAEGAQTAADLTGGFGVDSYFFSQKARMLVYVEQDEALFKVASHNFEKLGADNVVPIHEDAGSFIENTGYSFDFIYLDPARRDESKKVFMLEDCQPDILSIKKRLLELSPTVLIKCSPMLDISSACGSLGNVSEVHVLSIGNECKELLLLMKRGFEGEATIHCANLTKKRDEFFVFNKESEKNASSDFSEPLCFLYEPNASVMKAGGFKSVAQDYGLKKLALHTHLYTSEKPEPMFPGKIFEIIKVLKVDKKEVTAHLPEGKANICVRNFQMKPADLAKKLGVKDGGELFLFACNTESGGNKLVLCKKWAADF